MKASAASGLSRAFRLVGQPLAAALDWALPRRCVCCGVPVAAGAPQAGLCPDCWPKLSFLAPPLGTRPLCLCCGVPLGRAESGICSACTRQKPRYRRARAALLYDDISKPLVLRFKQADRTEGARLFAAWMVRAGGEVLEEADVLIPVPLHRWRLLRRQFNQAALLAQAIGRETGIPTAPTALKRLRATGTQRQRSRAERRRNLTHAIDVSPGWAARLAGKHIVVIDDVLTSGATLDACAASLLRAGAASVQALVLARVPSPDDPERQIGI
ncbi:MAG: ComF family protein [Elstera sp.]